MSFGVINQHLLSTEKFISTLHSENYIQMSLQDVPPNNFNSGIYIYKFIVTFSSTGTTIREDFCPESYRAELQNKIIEESEDMRDYCPICDFSDVKGNGGVHFMHAMVTLLLHKS